MSGKLWGDIFKPGRAAIVAEIGLNHNGDFSEAMALVEAAARAGADAVKFQTLDPEKLVSVYARDMLAGKKELEADNSTLEFFKNLMLEEEQLRRLRERSEQLGLVFFSAPFDLGSVDLLERVGVRLFKIASSEVTNHELLEYVGSTRKPVLFSTGMSNAEEILHAIRLLMHHGSEVILLHCVSMYPVEENKINLRRMQAMARQFNLKTGFSDHSCDWLASVAAVSMGAVVIEKHFKLHGAHECPDASVSLGEEEFRTMVQEVRRMESMLGDGSIVQAPGEEVVARAARRSLFAAHDLAAGTVLQAADLIALRPGNGIPVTRRDEFIGKTVTKRVKSGYPLRIEHFSMAE